MLTSTLVAAATLILQPPLEEKLHLLGRQLQAGRALEEAPDAARIALLDLLQCLDAKQLMLGARHRVQVVP